VKKPAVKKPKATALAFEDRTYNLVEFRSAVIPVLQAYENLMVSFNAGIPRIHFTKVLAIDPGTTNIALALLDLEHDTEITSKIENPNLTLQSMRYVYIERIVEHWIRMFRPDVVFKEGVAHGAPFGVAEAGRLQYIIDRAAFEQNVPVITVSNPTMRKFLGVKTGQETKSMARMQVLKKFGKEFESNDETDAYAIAQTGLAILRGDIVVGKK
jgi:Holliday junction resolvasome RuvABC endonuclease subunit